MGLAIAYQLALMRELRSAVGSRSLIIHLPIPVFGVLLQLWALISRQPAFTRSQLKALTAGDEFEVIDWPEIFGVEATSLAKALKLAYHSGSLGIVEMPF